MRKSLRQSGIYFSPLRLLLLVLVATVAFQFVAVRGAPASAQAPSGELGDDRFGVVLTGDPQTLRSLGTRWFISGDWSISQVPPGLNWIQYVRVGHDARTPAEIARQVAAWPGSSWLIGNEPNVPGGTDELSAAQYAQALHDVAAIIKGVDPTAQLIGPNVINFDFTCIDCPGYTSGHAWIDEFLTAYQAAYQSLPPLDAWSIHTYPLDFDSFPQVNAGIVKDQLTALRAYLDGLPGLAGAPIWDTEVGTHWGYDGLMWGDDGSGGVKATPVGSYRTDLLLGYMQDVLSWLSSEGPGLHVDRWFIYGSYVSIPEPWETVYGGINLLDGPAGASVSPFGQLYRALAGLSPWTP